MARSTSRGWQSIDSIIEKVRLFLSLVLLLTGMTSGCLDNSSRISSAVFATQTSGEPVVQAATNALKMIGYQVGERTDPENARKGLRAIDGERVGGMETAGPAIVRIHILVKSFENGAEIQVHIIPPKGAYGSTAIPLNDYQYTLSQLLPDLTVKSKTVPKEWL